MMAGAMHRGILFVAIMGFVLSEGNNIIKRDGETVTLQMSKTGHLYPNYLWNFGRHSPVEAITVVTNGEVTRINGTRFVGRLHTDVETGSITISNLTVNDTGVFLAQTFTATGILLQTVNLTVTDNTAVLVNVLEGNNVTLDSGLQELEKDHNVMWTQGPDFGGKQIAQRIDFVITIEESFQDILLLNATTGDLTFLRVTTNITGFYCVKIKKGKDVHILRQFHIIVYEPVFTPNITSAQPVKDGLCSASCSVKNSPDAKLSWYQEEKILNQTSNHNISISLSLTLDIQSPTEANYTCEAKNPVSIQTVTLNSTQWCPAHSSDWTVLQIFEVACGVLGGLALLLAVIVCLKCRCKNQKRGANSCEMQEESAEDPPEGNDEPLLPDRQQHEELN